MSGWLFDVPKTRRRYQALLKHYQQAGLNADNFACPHYAACEDSQRGAKNLFKGGTLGLMPLYDVSYNGTPIRIFIIGKEDGYTPESRRYGKPELHPYGIPANFSLRCKQCLQATQRTTLNPHIKGTLLTLQRIFEVQSQYLYASYALGNGLRCAFQKDPNSENHSDLPDTPIMRRNCFPYLVKEIEILEPTLVITQGNWAIDANHPVMAQLHRAFGPSKRLMVSSNGKHGLYEFPSFMYLTSYHPARLGPWKTRLAPDALWPMIDHLKDIGYLPHISSEEAAQYEAKVKPAVDKLLNRLN